MILLDTNVISEQFRAVPDEPVIDWLNRQPPETLYLASMTVAELRVGVALIAAHTTAFLPGRRLFSLDRNPLQIGRAQRADRAELARQIIFTLAAQLVVMRSLANRASGISRRKNSRTI